MAGPARRGPGQPEAPAGMESSSWTPPWGARVPGSTLLRQRLRRRLPLLRSLPAAGWGWGRPPGAPRSGSSRPPRPPSAHRPGAGGRYDWDKRLLRRCRSARTPRKQQAPPSSFLLPRPQPISALPTRPLLRGRQSHGPLLANPRSSHPPEPGQAPPHHNRVPAQEAPSSHGMATTAPGRGRGQLHTSLGIPRGASLGEPLTQPGCLPPL